MIAKIMGLTSRELAEFGLMSRGDNYATLQICSVFKKPGPRWALVRKQPIIALLV